MYRLRNLNGGEDEGVESGGKTYNIMIPSRKLVITGERESPGV